MLSTAYVRRIFIILLCFLVFGLVIQHLLKPKSFGEFGAYRGNSLGEIASSESVHQGKEVCRECHDNIWSVHEKDIHFSVQCEVCHGPGNIHVKFYSGEDNSISIEDANLPKKYTLEGCLFCHRKLYSKPRTFAQIDQAEHYKFLGITSANVPCTECHSPHEPLFLLEPVKKARIHPAIFECENCHYSRPEKAIKDVPDHPVFFTCQDCHPAIVKDFPNHKHSFMRCTDCHLFYRENETSGRIFKNSNQRFCLLCHEQKSFRDPNKVPQIEFPKHVEDMASATDVNVGDLKDNNMVCLKCHTDFVHDSDLIKKIRGSER